MSCTSDGKFARNRGCRPRSRAARRARPFDGRRCGRPNRTPARSARMADDVEGRARSRAGWPRRRLPPLAHHRLVVLARERQQAAAGDRAQHHRADHRAGFARHCAHVEHVVLAAELAAPAPAGRRCRRGRRPAASLSAVVSVRPDEVITSVRSRVAHAVADLARGLQQLRGHERVQRAGHRIQAEHRLAAAQLRHRRPERPRCSRWSRRCAARRRGSTCSAPRSRHARAVSTSHSASTPPPSPPRAQTSRVIGSVGRCAHAGCSARSDRARAAQREQALVPASGSGSPRRGRRTGTASPHARSRRTARSPRSRRSRWPPGRPSADRGCP